MRSGWPWIGVLVLLCARPAAASFESSEVGGRAMALGHNFTSVADDASALYWNPAGLTQLRRHELFLSHDRSPNLEGLSRGFSALAMHVGPVSCGVGWQFARLEGALREDLFYLGVAHTPVRRSLGAFIAWGATLKIARLGLETSGFEAVPGLRSSRTRVTSDLGILLAPIPNVTAGLVARNLGRPEFDLVEGGERTALRDEIEWGISLRWSAEGWLHLSRVHHPGTEPVTKLGGEIRVASAMDVLAGVARGFVSSGIGLRFGGWRLDTAYQAHEALGITYRVALRRAFGTERKAVGEHYDDF